MTSSEWRSKAGRTLPDTLEKGPAQRPQTTPRTREYIMNVEDNTTIGLFLRRLETDLAQRRNVRDLPEDLTRAILAHVNHSEDFDADIEGVVAL